MSDEKMPDEYDDFDFNNLDEDLDDNSNFDDLDINYQTPAGERTPIGDFKEGISDSIKGLNFDTSAVKGQVERQFPVTSKLVEDATDTVGQLEHMRTGVMRDMAPTLNQMKVTGRRLLPRVKRVLPERVYDKIYEKLAPEEKDRKLSEEEMIEQGRDERISSELKAIFTAQQEQADEDKAEDKVDKYVQRSLEESRHKTTDDILRSIKAYNYARTHFTQTSFKGYLMKSLELKYRHLFVAKDTLALTKTIAQLLDKKLEAIKYNTSLPDYSKKLHFEAIKEQQREILIGKATETVGDFTANFRRNLMDNIEKKVKELTETTKSTIGEMTDMADLYMEADEMASEFGMEEENKGVIHKAGSYLGSMALTQAGKQLVSRGTKALGQYGGDIEKATEGFKRKAIFEVNDKLRNSENPVFRWFAENIIPTLDTDRGDSPALLKEKALEEIPFDVLTRRSIVEIIPGYLSKILQQITNVAHGTTDAPEYIFDLEKEDFITTDEFRKKEDKKLFGDKKSRAKEMESSLATLLGGYSAHGGDESEFYDNLPEIIKFINNIAKHGQNIKPKDIAKLAEGESLDTDYDTLAFKDIDDKTKLAQLLTKALFREDGTKDIDVSEDLDALTKRLSIDRDKSLLSELHMFGGLGTRRQYSHLMDESGNIDHNKLREIYADVDIDELIKEFPVQAGRYKEELVDRQKKRWLSSQTLDDSEITKPKEEDLSTKEKLTDIKKKTQDRLKDIYEEELLTNEKFTKVVELVEENKDTPENIKKTLGDMSEEAQKSVTDFINTVKSKKKRDEYIKELKDPENIKMQKDKINKQIQSASTKIQDQIKKGKDELSKHANTLSEKMKEKTGIDIQKSTKDAHANITQKATAMKEALDPTLVSIKKSMIDTMDSDLAKQAKAKVDTNTEFIKDQYTKGKDITTDTAAEVKKAVDPTLVSIKESMADVTNQIKDISDPGVDYVKDKYTQGKTYFDEQYQKGKEQFEKTKDETLEKASKIIKGADSDPEIKDTPHISGPGIYVQGAKQEMHIPLDEESVYWKQINSVLTEPIVHKLDESTRTITDAIGTTEEDELLTTTKEIRDIISEHVPNISQLTAVDKDGNVVASPTTEKKQGIFGKVKSAANRGVGTVYDTSLGLIKSGYGAVGSLMEGGANLVKSSAGGVGSGISALATGLGDVGKGALGLYGGILGGVGNRVKSFLSPGSKKKEPKFIAIYRKDEVDPGNPLVTARKQEQGGLVFEDGKPVERSSDIVEPVFDAETSEPIITQEDIDHGLVNVRNEPIAEAGSSSSSSGGKGILGKIIGAPMKLAKGMFPLAGKGLGMGMDIYKQLFDVTIGGIKGAGGIVKNLFGGGKKFADKEVIQELITDRLDAIYELLDEYISEATDTGEPRVGSYAYRKKKQKEQAKASKARWAQLQGAHTKKAAAAGTAAVGGAIPGAVSGMLGIEEDDEEESGGKKRSLVRRGLEASGLVAGYNLAKKKVGSVLGKSKRAVGKAARGAGGIITTGAKAIPGAISTTRKATSRAIVTGAKATGKALGTTAGRAAIKSGFKKVPLVGALAGLGFGTWRAFKGDFTGAGLEVASGAAGAVSFTGVGAAASLGIDALLLGRDIAIMAPDDMDDDTRALLAVRLKAYGADSNQTKKILRLESVLSELFRKGEEQDSDMIRILASEFGFDSKDETQVSYFATWLKNRFGPIFTKYQTLITQEYNVDLENQHELDSEEVKEVISKFNELVKDDISKFRSFVPTMDGYRTKIKDLDGLNTKKSGFTKSTTKEASYTPKQEKSDGFFSRLKNRFSRTPSIPEQRDTTKRPPRHQGAVATTPEEFMDSRVGAMSAKYESGTRGSGAIGYDRVGGTSYGKYQIASATGTFDDFLTWLDTQPGGAEVAERLRAAGSANTGTTDGKVPTEWKKLVKEGLMGDLEHEFIKATHYDPALEKINNNDFINKINSSKAFQDVLWSTAVQHGSSRAAEIFNRAYHPKLADEDIIREIYKDRSTRFRGSNSRVQQSVWSRFSNEKENAIAMVRLEEDRRTQVATHNMSPTASKDKPVVVGVEDTSTQPSLVADQSKITSKAKEKEHIDKVAKSDTSVSQIKLDPDTTQHKLSEEQIAVLKSISSGINNLSEQMHKSLGDGKYFEEMNASLKEQLKKESIVNVDTTPLVEFQRQQAFRETKGALDVSKHRSG